MPSTATIGQFEQFVMTAVLALADTAYGVSIHKKVEELVQPRSVSLGAIYATLDRLEDKALIRSHLSDPTPERGGRSKRLYQLEQEGERALREAALSAKRACDDLERIWGASAWQPGRPWKPARQS
jgi:PadR family transcriptional regulator PadR